MAILAKMERMAINRQNCQIVNKNSNKMAKGPFESGVVPKMAEMAINRQNRQIVNKNSNEMAKGLF